MDFFFFFFLLSISCLCLPKHVMLLFLPLLLFRISYGCYCAGGLILNPVGGVINPLSLGTRSMYGKDPIDPNCRFYFLKGKGNMVI
jgi:hypothetical protein